MTTAREQYLLERCLRLEADKLRLQGVRRLVTAADVEAMQELRDRGLFAREVAAQTGWGLATVNRHTVRR